MHSIIKNYIDKLSVFDNSEFIFEFIQALKYDEVILHNDTLLNQERALEFYSEKYEMQMHLEENQRLKGLNKLLEAIKELNSNKEIRVTDMIITNSGFLLFELDNSDEILGILKNPNATLEKKKIHLRTLKERQKNISLSINSYRFIEGKLIEYVK